jgi:diguanylate cyclase (GGDEF)-like protein
MKKPRLAARPAKPASGRTRSRTEQAIAGRRGGTALKSDSPEADFLHMEEAPQAAHGSVPVDGALLAAAASQAAAAASTSSAPPSDAIDAAVGTLHDAIGAILSSVFVLEHDRLWLVAQRGYAVVPDGIPIDRGVMGRAVRLGLPQHARDVHADPDYLPALPGIGAELALPLHVGSHVVGALNLESERGLPENSADLLEPLASALAPLADALRRARTLDLPALARLFVHLGSLRDPNEIAGIAAVSLRNVLPVETTQVVVWNDAGAPTELASWRSERALRALLGAAGLEAARGRVHPTAICALLDPVGRGSGDQPAALVWLPLRANGVDIGAFVAAVLPEESVDPVDLDTAAVLAAQVAASLDAAFAFQRERRSALTDSLTGVLNRRGLEERLEEELLVARDRRLPLSLIVIDCDDFKEINDRAGHEFGDALLQEVANLLARALPTGAVAARLGGDEFVVMLPGAEADDATEVGARIRAVLAESLTDAGYPLRVSAGISTFPYDGGTSTTLLRASDQALYAAKNAGKDRVASFHDVVRPEAVFEAPNRTGEQRRRAGASGAILAEVVAATTAIDRETTAEDVCNRLCKSLVFAVGVTACMVSRIAGGHLVDVSRHSLREVSLGDDAAYRIADFPLTAQTLETGEPRTVSFLDADVDPAEAFVLREIGMNALLMLSLEVDGAPWGLVELYEMRLRRFDEDEIAVARFLVTHAARRLAAVGTRTPLRPWPRVYELPSEGRGRRGPRTR